MLHIFFKHTVLFKNIKGAFDQIIVMLLETNLNVEVENYSFYGLVII